MLPGHSHTEKLLAQLLLGGTPATPTGSKARVAACATNALHTNRRQWKRYPTTSQTACLEPPDAAALPTAKGPGNRGHRRTHTEAAV